MILVEDRYENGAIIQERYLVKDILGRGGFSVVYLVEDQQPAGEQQPETHNRFALKMLTDRDIQERVRFLFEGELLTRLEHPALPRIHHVFEDETSHRACIVMDFVEGTNLDSLRKRQPGNRLSLTQALTILAPVVEALSYLHTQPTPIIHRDVKPSNLIVREDGQGTSLVDFGIAKEYELDATTTAVRHCSPGYGAPEQYSSIGTDQRTDIYGIGATLYALLSGKVPVDALQRATKLAGKDSDPLTPLHEIAPGISAHVASAIYRAMSISMEKRFSSVEEFWQALQSAGSQEGQSNDDQDKREDRANTEKRHLAVWRAGVTGKKAPVMTRMAFALLALLIIGGLAFGIGSYFGDGHTLGAARSIVLPDHAASTASPKGVYSAQKPYPTVAQTYDGTVHDLLANVTTFITLTRIVQSNERISGSFSGLHQRGTFSGVIDTSRHIYFTVSGQPSLYFQGTIRSDNNLAGNYCTVDSSGQCVGNYGIWSLAPTTPETR